MISLFSPIKGKGGGCLCRSSLIQKTWWNMMNNGVLQAYLITSRVATPIVGSSGRSPQTFFGINFVTLRDFCWGKTRFDRLVSNMLYVRPYLGSWSQFIVVRTLQKLSFWGTCRLTSFLTTLRWMQPSELTPGREAAWLVPLQGCLWCLTKLFDFCGLMTRPNSCSLHSLLMHSISHCFCIFKTEFWKICHQH